MALQPNRRELAAEERLLNEPGHRKARDKIAEFIAVLQAAKRPEDYVELHRSVLAHFGAYQEIGDELVEQRRTLRARIRELARQSPKPLDSIREQQRILDRIVGQEALMKAVHHALREVGDGIAWQALRYDRSAFSVLGEGERVGRLAVGIGREAEFRALAELWVNEAIFAIHNDMTNCLRHGDLTGIRENDSELEVTLYEVKAGRSRDEAQLRRLNRATDLLRSHLDPAGGTEGQPLRVTIVPRRYETFLPELPALIEKAKSEGFAWMLPHRCLLVGAVDYRVWGRGNVDDFTLRFERRRKEVGWASDEPDTVNWTSSMRRLRDRRESFSSLAPFTIFPLPADDVADVVMGPIDLFLCLHLGRLEETLTRNGIAVRVARPPESGSLFLEASRAKQGVRVPPHLREQMMAELVTPDCIFTAIEHVLDLNEANPREVYDSRIVAFADERDVWARNTAATSGSRGSSSATARHADTIRSSEP